MIQKKLGKFLIASPLPINKGTMVTINNELYNEMRDKKISCVNCAFVITIGKDIKCIVDFPDRPRCTAEFREDTIDVIFVKSNSF